MVEIYAIEAHVEVEGAGGVLDSVHALDRLVERTRRGNAANAGSERIP